MEFTNRLLEQLKQFWGKLSGRQKASLVAAVALLLSGLMGLVIWSNQIDYQPLFTNLKPEQVGPLVDSLKARKERYKLSNGGTAIEVPAERVLELRMSLASDGLLKDGVVGFELFDNGGIGVTNFVERLNYQRALQGELVRTINQIEQVEASRVHLVLPRESLFVSDQKPATASVVLKLKQGKRLSKEQVQGIVSLVAASIEGLKAENVSVVDTEGTTLAAPREDSMAAIPGTMLEYQEALERKLEERVQSFLEKVVGPGKVIAKVQAALEMTSIETTAESYNPEVRIPRSEQTRSETRNNVGPDAQGVPGTASNLPGNAPANTETTGKAALEKKESTINYEIDKTVSRTVQAPGQLKRLSVAVIIDGTYKEGKAPDGTEGTTKLEYTARTDEEMKLFDRIVRNAVGYNEERGDEVSVSNMQFNQLSADVIPETQSIAWEKPVRYAMVFVGMLMVFLLIRPLLKSVAEELKPPEEAADAAANLLPGATGEPGQLAASSPQLKMLTAGSAEKQRREEMINLARSDLENTVQTVRDWLRTG